MKEYKDVQSTVEPKPIEVNVTKTYIRSNIRQEELVFGEETELMWVYDEIKYDNQEYIEMLSQEKETLQAEVNIMKRIIDYFATVINVE